LVAPEGVPSHRLLTLWERGGAGDGLPVVAPTADSMAEMLRRGPPAATALAPLPPGLRPMTVGDVAACAVMAGCRPGVLAILLAALAGVADPEFNLLGVATTTGNAAVGMVVHGDIAADTGITGGVNCLGPTPAANGAIGRALAVCLRLLAGAVAGQLDMATVGQPAKYGLCLTEAGRPAGWPPLHHHLGVATASAVTVFTCSGILEVADASARDGAELLATLAAALPLPAAAGLGGSGASHHLVVLPPEWAAKLAAGGWTRASIGQHLYEQATVPVDRLPAHMTTGGRPRADGPLRWAGSPGDLLIAVAGGVGIKATYLPGWPGGSRAVTVPILPG
jgi:hypothetical protein